MVSNLEQALSLARQGLAIFPCHSGGDKVKSPMPFIKWREASTCDEGQIRHWWQKWPEAAIGLDLAKSGLLVIDCDRHNEEENGVAAFGKLAHRHNFNMDSAPLVATPNRGTHVFFKQSPKAIIGNGRGNLPSGIDVRGNGGYVIAPGTIMQDGRDYELFGDIALAPVLPDWLLDILKSPKNVIEEVKPHSQPVRQQNNSDDRIARYCDAAIADEVTRVESAKKGERNNTLNQSAFALGQLVGAGWVSETEISALLLNAATQNGVPVSEAQKTIRSGIKAGIKEPRQELDDDFVDFDPVEAKLVADMIMAAHEKHEREKNGAKLVIMGDDGIAYDADTGEIIEEEEQEEAVADEFHLEYPEGLVGDIARWITETALYPQPELAIGAALALVGTVSARQFMTPISSGGTTLYMVGLSGTGTGKDHPLKMPAFLLRKAGLTQHIGPSDVFSMSAVHTSLKSKPVALWTMDEFGSILKRINGKRSSSNENNILKAWREIWSSPYDVIQTSGRADSEAVEIYAPATFIHAMSTPKQFYAGVNSDIFEDGTMNRFLLLKGRSNVEMQKEPKDKFDVPKHIINSLKYLYSVAGDLTLSYRNSFDVNPAESGTIIKLTWCPDGAEKLYEKYTAKITKIINRSGSDEEIYNRSNEKALRIAAILTIGRIDGWGIRKCDLEYAISLVDMSNAFMKEGADDNIAENDIQANYKLIKRIISGQEEHKIPRWLLTKKIKGRIHIAEMNNLLKSLIEAKEIEEWQVKSETGRTAYWYRLNKQ